MSPSPRLSFGLKGSTALLVAIAVVVTLIIAVPGYWLFFLVSALIGVVIWGGLRFWYRLHPLKEEDVVEDKRPLGL